mmetsp:Transcript_9167/g.20240  ORF Transcript_9167/g.20240 Transcript_9167/m.20240 type:complete len:372 (-) Transcript_9167:134-1249(-)
MPPKVDKKAAKEREKIAVDKTFGMKNKNKSKQVQKYIKSITQNLAGSSHKAVDTERKLKEDKEKALQQSALLNSLFNMATDKKGRAFDPVAKKKAKEAEEEAIAAGKKLKEEVRKEIIEGIANSIRMTNPKGCRMSELGGHAILLALKEKHPDTFKTISLLLFIKANHKVFWVDDPDEKNPTIRCQEDVDAEVNPDERPIEEIIEEKRAALPPGGTPVTKESFEAWKVSREAARLAAVQEQRDAAKKGGAKGITGMSGRDLFTFDASLFVDDEGAVSANEYEEPSENEDEDDEPQQGHRGKDDESDEEAEGAKEQEGGGDADEAEEDGAKDPAAQSSGGPGASGSGAVAINKDLFLQEEELPDDLDDLDDD